MACNIFTGPNILKEISRYSKMKVQEYTKTLYNKKGKLLDDGVDLESDSLYWDSFIDPKQSAELERRLKLVESESWQPGDEEFLQMEDDDD